MLWTFERSGERLQCEIRWAADGAGVELVWTRDGQTRVERFADTEQATVRRRDLEAKLTRDGWNLSLLHPTPLGSRT